MNMKYGFSLLSLALAINVTACNESAKPAAEMASEKSTAATETAMEAAKPAEAEMAQAADTAAGTEMAQAADTTAETEMAQAADTAAGTEMAQAADTTAGTETVMTGGYSSIEPDDARLEQARQFAEAGIQEQVGGEVTVAEILSAEQQVVAGSNYRLQLRLSDDSVYTVVVYEDLQGNMELTSLEKN